jgi:hypothetical protein
MTASHDQLAESDGARDDSDNPSLSRWRHAAVTGEVEDEPFAGWPGADKEWPANAIPSRAGVVAVQGGHHEAFGCGAVGAAEDGGGGTKRPRGPPVAGEE